MKATSALFLFVLPLTLFGGEVKLGDNLELVQATLGVPRGQMQAGARNFLTFDRGDIELVSGVVTRVALRSEEAQTAFETRRTADAIRLREEMEVRRIKQTAEGAALKAAKLADETFQSAPARIQVEYWRNFAAQYPMVSCTEPLNLARAQLYAQEHTERIEAEEAQRLAELKEREASQKVFYPIYSRGSYAYESGYYDQYRQRRLDREYYDRIRASSRTRTDSQLREDHDRKFERDRHDRVRDQAALYDHRPATLVAYRASECRESPRGTVVNRGLLPVGQDAMAWDGTKVPGGEAVRLFR